MKIFSRFINLYLRRTNPVKWARRLGVKVGEGTTISETTFFPTEAYLVTIGNHVQITRDVAFHTHGGSHVARRVIPDFDAFGRVEIKDFVYIGSRSMILPGVTVGEGALIAAGSVVTKSVRPGMVVAGNPAKEICTVEDYIRKNSKFNLHTKGMGPDKKKQFLLQLDDFNFIIK